MSADETTVVTTADAEVNTNEATTPVVASTEDKGNIPGEVFVRVWQESNSRQEALDKFTALGYHLEYGSLGARAKSFIKKGVTLKKMPRAKTTGRKGKTLDVAKLNEVVNQLAADAAAVKTAAAPQGDASAS